MIDKLALMSNGQPPPFLIPFCASCDMPVEAFTVHPVPEHDGQPMFVADAECHGKTSGIMMALADWEKLHSMGRKLILFQRREGFDSVR